jgi:Putative Actinobacterial Holin-X, holin superfamily III
MATRTENGRDNRSTSELIHAVTEQSRRLIRQEMALARAELTQNGTQAGFGSGCSAPPAFCRSTASAHSPPPGSCCSRPR